MGSNGTYPTSHHEEHGRDTRRDATALELKSGWLGYCLDKDHSRVRSLSLNILPVDPV